MAMRKIFASFWVLFMFKCVSIANGKHPLSYIENAIANREIGISHDEVEFSSAEDTMDNEDFGRATVSKCCNLGQGYTFENKSTCVETASEFLPDFEDRPDYSENVKQLPANARFEYFIGDPCTDGKYILDTTTYSYDKYTIFSNGTLLYLDEIYSKEEFCVELLNSTIRVFICFGAGRNVYSGDFKYVLYAVGLLISVPFLLATAVTYLSVDVLRDLRGKSLACHVLCLAIGYMFLALVQLASNELTEDACIATGFIIQFFFVAAFFWLNVISFDTWRCIKNNLCSIYKSVNSSSEKITFCYYFIYGFYGPIVLSIVSLIMDFEPAIPESYLKPHFGFQSCWFYSDEAALPYFFAPVGVTICINFVFFILSVRKVYNDQKNKTYILNQNKDLADEPPETSPRFSAKVYIRILQETIYLFCLMGINWTAEIISWVIGGSDLVWLVTDIFNTLQGVTIFYIFILRPSTVRNQVKIKFQKIFRKTFVCDCSNREESKSVTRIRHSVGNETLEMCLTSQNQEFTELPTSV